MKKRMIILLLAVMSLFLAGGALAGTSFPGKTVGFRWGSTNVYTIMTLKLNGTAKMSSPTKFYTVAGVTFDTVTHVRYPVSGSAFVYEYEPNQKVLSFTLSGSNSSFEQFIDLEGRIEQPSTGSKWVAVRVSTDNTWGSPSYIFITPLTDAEIKALSLD